MNIRITIVNILVGALILLGALSAVKYRTEHNLNAEWQTDVEEFNQGWIDTIMADRTQAYDLGYTERERTVPEELKASFAEGYAKAVNEARSFMDKRGKKGKPLKLSYILNSKLFWDSVAIIESDNGNKMFQGRYTTCEHTSNYCGWFQLGKAALIDLKLWTPKGRADRTHYSAALKQAKRYMKMAYYRVPPEYRKYMIAEKDFYILHNQGASFPQKLAKLKAGKLNIKAERKRLYALWKNIPKSKRKGLRRVVKRKTKKARKKYGTFKVTYKKDKLIKTYETYWDQRWTQVEKRARKL